jgi:hypothetical protein
VGLLRNSTTTNASAHRATVLGGVFVIFGLYAIVAGLGFVPVRASPGVRPWVVVAAGAMFMLAGLSFINGKDPERERSFHVRLIGLFLSLSVLSLMCAIFAWIAFGSGERHFSTWSSLAGRPLRVESSERSGRIAFGICAGILATFLILSGVDGLRQLRRG